MRSSRHPFVLFRAYDLEPAAIIKAAELLPAAHLKTVSATCQLGGSRVIKAFASDVVPATPPRRVLTFSSVSFSYITHHVSDHLSLYFNRLVRISVVGDTSISEVRDRT